MIGVLAQASRVAGAVAACALVAAMLLWVGCASRKRDGDRPVVFDEARVTAYWDGQLVRSPFTPGQLRRRSPAEDSILAMLDTLGASALLAPTFYRLPYIQKRLRRGDSLPQAVGRYGPALFAEAEDVLREYRAARSRGLEAAAESALALASGDLMDLTRPVTFTDTSITFHGAAEGEIHTCRYRPARAVGTRDDARRRVGEDSLRLHRDAVERFEEWLEIGSGTPRGVIILADRSSFESIGGTDAVEARRQIDEAARRFDRGDMLGALDSTRGPLSRHSLAPILSRTRGLQP